MSERCDEVSKQCAQREDGDQEDRAVVGKGHVGFCLPVRPGAWGLVKIHPALALFAVTIPGRCPRTGNSNNFPVLLSSQV